MYDLEFGGGADKWLDNRGFSVTLVFGSLGASSWPHREAWLFATTELQDQQLG